MRRVIFFHNNISRIATKPEDFLSRFNSYLQVAKSSLGDAPLDLNLLLGRIHTDTRFDEIKVVRLSNSLLSQYPKYKETLLQLDSQHKYNFGNMFIMDSKTFI